MLLLFFVLFCSSIFVCLFVYFISLFSIFQPRLMVLIYCEITCKLNFYQLKKSLFLVHQAIKYESVENCFTTHNWTHNGSRISVLALFLCLLDAPTSVLSWRNSTGYALRTALVLKLCCMFTSHWMDSVPSTLMHSLLPTSRPRGLCYNTYWPRSQPPGFLKQISNKCAGDRAFSPCCVQLKWNTFHFHIRSAPSVAIFKSRLTFIHRMFYLFLFFVLFSFLFLSCIVFCALYPLAKAHYKYCVLLTMCCQLQFYHNLKIQSKFGLGSNTTKRT